MVGFLEETATDITTIDWWMFDRLWSYFNSINHSWPFGHYVVGWLAGLDGFDGTGWALTHKQRNDQTDPVIEIQLRDIYSVSLRLCPTNKEREFREHTPSELAERVQLWGYRGQSNNVRLVVIYWWKQRYCAFSRVCTTIWSDFDGGTDCGTVIKQQIEWLAISDQR